jgi:hypothetical protein
MFLDDQIMEMYADYESGLITIFELSDRHAKAVAEKLGADPTLTNLKRIVNSLNLCVDNIEKEYGYSALKKLSYDDLYNEVFNKKATS